MKRFVAVIMALVLCMGMRIPSLAEEGYPDVELARAVSLGIGEYHSDNPDVSHAEFFVMLDRAVELADSSKLAEWKALMTEARESERIILRCEAMVALYYAAETLGPDYVGFNDGGPFHATVGDRLYPGDDSRGMDENMSLGDYELFPDPRNADISAKYQDNFYAAAAYYNAIGRLSLATYRPLFELDEEAQSFRAGDPLAHTEALLAALRLYESVLPPVSERVPTELDREILAAADARREAIRSTPTTIAVTGKSYYVSNDGNDKNNGLSPEKPWKTVDRMKKAKLKPGDGVFFRRGDIWRDLQFDAREGVSYSAYGEGEKPRFYGSPEDGADPKKWKLLRGTDNIWVFYKDMRDCGAVVFDEGASFAQKEYLYWDGKKYVTFTTYRLQFNETGTDAFKPTDLKNLRFYNDINYSKAKMDREPSFDEGVDYIMPKGANQLKGKLYLRCDAGNPGDVYRSIEFCMDRSKTHEAMIGVYTFGVTLDNLCLKYSAHSVSLGMPTTMQYNNKDFSKGTPNTVQNCEIGWMAGTTERFATAGFTVYSGDGMHIEGSNNAMLNCYVYECQDSGIPIEVCPTYRNFGDDWQDMQITWENLTIKGNLVERCNAGLYVQNWELPANPRHLLRNILIEDNYVLYSGYGHSGQRDMDIWMVSSDGRAELANAWGHSLTFFGPDEFANANDGLHVRDNVFYLARSTLINSGMPERYYPDFSGNTYVQNNYGNFAYWREPDGREVIVNMARPDIADYVNDVLGDESAILAPMSE